MRIGLFFKFHRAVVKWSENREIPDLWGRVDRYVLFSLYINDTTEDIDSELRLFADDCVCYHEIKYFEDTVKLQEDIGSLGCWARS